MRAHRIASNLGKNALAPFARRALPNHGRYGMDGDLDAVCDVLERLAPGLEALGCRLAGARVLELGPGRTPEVLAACLLAGAESGLGVDPFPQLGQEAADPSRFAALAERIADGGAPAFLEAVGSDAAGVLDCHRHWQEDGACLRLARFDGVRLPAPDSHTDLVISKSVLEHVAPADVDGLLGETRRVLCEGGWAVHIIDLRDHTAIASDNTAIDADRNVRGDWLEALTYPEPLFRAMFSRRSTAINRLRACQWRTAFERAGFAIEGWRTGRFPLAPRFDAGRLQAPWRTYPLEELEIGFLTLAVRATTA